MSRVVKLAVIPGDGIGREVIAQAERVLDAVTAGTDVTFEKTPFSLGADRFLATGDTLTDADLDAIRSHDAILLGAVGGVPGDPRLKDANIERGLLLKLRFELDHYVNLRPSKLFAGAPPYPFHAQVREATAPYFYEAITGELSPQEALDKMAATAEDEMKKLGYRK